MLPHAATVTRLRALFARSRSSVARSDKNKDGFIDGAELRELLTRGGNSDTKGSAMTEDDCTALISSFDDNGDGKLSIEEVRAPCGARKKILVDKPCSSHAARATIAPCESVLAALALDHVWALHSCFSCRVCACIITRPQLVAAWVTIGGGDEDLDAAIREKRAAKEKEAKAAIDKKKAASAQADEVKKQAEEARLKDKRNLMGQSQKDKDNVELQDRKAKELEREEAEEEMRVAIASGDTSKAGYQSQYLEDADKPQTAAERAREAASKKVGKSVKAGQGTLSGDTAAADPANMTAAERAKLKAKEELAAKEARKKAAKEAKKKKAASEGA